MKRGEKIDPVITPAEISWKIGDRHHLYDGDSDARQLLQLLSRSLPRSFLRKSADVHFVNDMTFQVHAAPFGIRPCKLRWIDNARRSVRSVWLKSRGGIGMKMLGLVYAKTVEASCANIGRAGKITAFFAPKRLKRPLRIFFRTL